MQFFKSLITFISFYQSEFVVPSLALNNIGGRMKNNLVDLNNYLFEELERLNDDETLMNEDTLEKELKRSKAITEVSSQIVQNAKIMLEAKKHSDNFGFSEDKFYSSKNETKMIDNKPYEDFAKEIKNKPSREEFKDKLLFEMDKPKL